MNELIIELANAQATEQLAKICLSALVKSNDSTKAVNSAEIISLTKQADTTELVDLLQSTDLPELKAQINLRGDLGAGKTSFTRAFLKNCGVKGRIKSPSYTLVETYVVSNLYLYHFDFYRFSDTHEWRDAGFDELLAQNAISLIEWPEQAGGSLPPPDLEIYLEYAGQGRKATISAHSTKGQQWLQQINNLIR